MSTSDVDDNSSERERLLSALIEGEPSPEEAARINELMGQDEVFRNEYLKRMEVHALLAWRFHAVETLPAMRRITRWQSMRSRMMRWAAACIVITGLLSFFLLRGESASAACLRLIQLNETIGDRTYKISADYDKNALKPLENRPFDPQRAPLPSIDGATLHIGSGDRFVLFRKYANGELLTAGFDGREAWAIRGDSPVRVSTNRARFRGDIPGGEQDVPFTDMRSNLTRLQSAYVLELLEPHKLNAQSASPSHRLRGVKRSPLRGPQSIEIYYDAATGIIQRMIFDGMTQHNGGPVRATLDLIEQRDLGQSWYDHAAHHEPRRELDRVD